MGKISAETFKRRVLNSLPEQSTSPLEGPALGEAVVADLSSLGLIADDEQFLKEAYRLILGREPDMAGFLHHRESMRSGVPRELIIHRLVKSDEGRRLGRKVAGLSGLRSLPGKFRYWTGSGKRSLGHKFTGKLRAYVREVLQMPRMERIERTLDSLFHDLLVRSDQISAKEDRVSGHCRLNWTHTSGCGRSSLRL